MSTALSILVVRGELLICMMLEDFLESLGRRVHETCESVSEAVKAVGSGGFELAILDVNLKGESVWPVVGRLRERNVPFVLATGGNVDPLPSEFVNVPVIQKPITIERVTTAIDAAFAF